jgi:hypothetical protein
MLRVIMILYALLLVTAPALAQPSDHLLGGAPAPPAMMPGPIVSPGYAAPRQFVFPNRPPVEVPGGPSGFSDKVRRCIDAGAAAGLGPNENAAFTRRCAN